MTHDELARKFAELNGIRWYEWENSIGFTRSPNPTYSTAESVLEVMMKHPKWDKFLETVGGYDEDGWQYIRAHCLYNKDSLLKAAVEWCKEHKVEVKK